MLVPIHAYPIMNETKFPGRIDFGKCAIGETYTKYVRSGLPRLHLTKPF